MSMCTCLSGIDEHLRVGVIGRVVGLAAKDDLVGTAVELLLSSLWTVLDADGAVEVVRVGCGEVDEGVLLVPAVAAGVAVGVDGHCQEGHLLVEEGDGPEVREGGRDEQHQEAAEQVGALSVLLGAFLEVHRGDLAHVRLVVHDHRVLRVQAAHI